jgi:hypothetical protein
MWPLVEPLPATTLGTLFALLLLVLAFDRWDAYRNRSSAREENNQEPVTIAEWVLGRACRRVWNSDPGEFEMEATGELFRLTEEHLRTHMILVAPTGSGKTRSVLEPALHLFKRTAAAAIYLDAKGNDFDPAQFHLNFSLDSPSSGPRLNIWSGRTPREMGERLGEALVPDAGVSKAYFVNNAKDTMAALVDAHHTAYGKMPALKQLLAYLRSEDAREDLAEELRGVGLSDESDELVDLHRIGQLAAQKNDVLGGLDTALAPLARGDVAGLLATGGDGYSVEQLVAQPIRARFALPVGDHPRIAPIIGRLVLAQFTYAVTSPACNKRILKAAVVDEAKRFVTPAIAQGMAMARENRGCYILAFQNLSQIGDATLREDILSAAGNKLVMAGVGDYEAEKFSRLFGSREQLYISHTENSAQGSNHSHSLGSGRNDMLGGAAPDLRQQSSTTRSASTQHSQGSSKHVRERAYFLPSEIRDLPQFHVLIERRDSRGQATPATLVDMEYELISGIRNAQALSLYKQLGHLEAVSPKLPTTAKRTRLFEASVNSHAELAEKEAVVLSETPTDAATNGETTFEAGSIPETAAVSVQATQTASDGTASGVAYPDWVEAAARSIDTTLDIGAQQALELARQAHANGRDAAYIAQLLVYARSAPNVKSPAALFTFLVRANRPVPEASTGKRQHEHTAEKIATMDKEEMG